jgi:hypothetical protein
MAVYLDDCVSGQIVTGNVFVRVARAALVGGGRDNIVENNVFVDCVPAVHVDGRGVSTAQVWSNMVNVTMKERLDEMKHREPPYSVRYPELLRLDKYYEGKQGVPPEDNVIARNICVGGRWLDIVWGAKEEDVTVIHNLVNADPHFVDAAHDDYRLRDDSPAWTIGFERIPIEQIGLVQDEDRTAVNSNQ